MEKEEKPKRNPPYSLKRVTIVFVALLVLAFFEFFCWYHNIAA